MVRSRCWSGESVTGVKADAEAENQLLERIISSWSREADAEAENQFWSGIADAVAKKQMLERRISSGVEKQMRGQRSRYWRENQFLERRIRC